MKFRCVTNSIRFRLGKSDVETFKSNGVVDTSLEFGNHVRFCYRLSTGSLSEPAVEFSDNCLTVSLPAEQGRHWADSDDEISLQFRHPIGDGKYLDVLVEKDFPCKHGPEKENKDAFHELVD